MTLKVLAFMVFVVPILSLQNKYCQLSCDFVVTTITHTVCDRAQEKCGPDQKCGPNFKILKLTDHQREYIVDLHNYLRNKVASGNERRKNQPPAANMNILSYSKELEFIAQCWANTCNGNPLIHDTCRRTTQYDHVGQNLGFINSSSPNINLHSSIKQLVMLWYDEVAIFENEWVKDTQDRGHNFKVGHYTQMVWADTTEIGCAASSYTTNQGAKTWHHLVFVCNYGPGGNYLGLPVYEIGKPCSKCPDDMPPNKQYKGLCGSKKRMDRSKFDIFEL